MTPIQWCEEEEEDEVKNSTFEVLTKQCTVQLTSKR